jgi:hypothetical protein
MSGLVQGQGQNGMADDWRGGLNERQKITKIPKFAQMSYIFLSGVP